MVGLAETGRSVVEVGKIQRTDSDNKEQHIVEQWCPTLFMEIYIPAEFSSNPASAHLPVIIK